MRRTATLGLGPPFVLLSAIALVVATLLGAAIDARQAAGPRRYVLATGRRIPYLYVISLDAALDPRNDRTSNAVVGRSKVARLDSAWRPGRLLAAAGRLSGRPELS